MEGHIGRVAIQPRGILAAALMVASLVACAPAIHQRNGLPVVTNGEEIRVHVVKARGQLDSALFRVDLQRLFRQLTPDATVVLANGDSARGRDSVAALINRDFARSIGARFQMFPSRRDVCLDGAVEYDSDVIAYVAYADRVDTLTAKYAAKWRNAAGASWLLERLVLGPASADRRSVAGVCERISIAQFDASRVHLSIMPSLASYQQLAAKKSLESGLQAIGYETSSFPLTPGQKAIGFAEGNEGGPAGLASVRWRVTDAWSIEGVANYTPLTFASVGKKAATTSLVRIEVKNQMAGAMAQYDWGRWRAGGGVTLVMTDWNEFEYDYSQPLAAGSARRQASTTVLAPLVGAAYTLPISSRFGVELWGLYRFGQDQLPAFGSVPAGVAVRVDAAVIGVFAVFAF